MDLISILLVTLPIYITLPFIYWTKHKHQNKRKDPFYEFDIERPAGYSVNNELLSKSFDVGGLFANLIAAGAIFAIVISNQAINQPTKIFLTVLFVIFFIVVLIRLIKLVQNIFNLRDGLKAEQLVGQSLTQLLYSKFYVYHDIPATSLKFNIDHVVVCPSGVFAVETKSRRKGISGTHHKVSVKNDKLEFSTWTDTKIIEQAKRQTKWLSQELTSSTGEHVAVSPIVALPGYFVERKDKSSVLVLNHKLLSKPQNYVSNNQLSEEQIKRICYQLKQMQKIDSELQKAKS
jgi:hypothetical protein